MMPPTPRLLRAACALGLGACLWHAPARAADETTVLDRVNRELDETRQAQAQEAASDQFSVNWGGEAALSYVYSDRIHDIEYSAARGDLKIYGFLNDADKHMVYVRVRALHDDGFDKNIFLDNQSNGESQRDMVYFDRFWYRIDLNKAMDSQNAWNARAQVGLQQVRWGSGLVLDNALYAGLADVGGRVCEAGEVWLTGMVGYTPNRDFYEFDRSRPDYHNEVNRLFYGGQVAWQDTGPTHTKVYGYLLGQRDHNPSQATTPLGVPAFLTPMPATYGYDSYYLGLGAAGAVPGLSQLTYLAEGVLERGRSTTSPMDSTAFIVPQTRENIRAWAAQAQLTWNFRDSLDSRVEVEGLAGSGDSDRFGSSSSTLGGNTSGTTDTAFNAFGFARTGLLYNAPVSNLLSVRLGASTFIVPKQVRLGADAFLLRKLDGQGASNETTRAGKDLGFEMDFHADWKVLSDLTVGVHYGFFVPGDATSDERNVRHFIFTGVRYAF